MADSNSFFSDPKNKVIETAHLTIREHLLRWDDTAIQISNVSMVAPENLPLPSFPKWSILLFVVGGLLVGTAEDYYREDERMGFGICLLFIGIAWLIIWGIACMDRASKKYLRVQLNSGGAYFLYFANQDFMRQVLQLLADIIESGSTNQTYFSIDVHDCHIRDSTGNIIHIEERAR